MPNYTDDYKKEIKDYKDQLTRESFEKANELEIPGDGRNDAQDAFRHAYSSAVVTYDYNRGIAYAAGLYNELDTPNNPPGEERMDTYNNEVGRQIGSEAGSKEEIAQKVYEALEKGQLIIDPDDEDPSSPFDNEISIPSSSRGTNFLPGEWDWMERSGGGADGMGGFDLSPLLDRILGGNRSRGKSSAGQILATSAAGLARAVIESRRKSLEDAVLGALTGRPGSSPFVHSGFGQPQGRTPPYAPDFSGSRGSSLPAALGSLVDNMVGAAFSRRRTRITTTESERSREAARNWHLSRSQQQAMLAQWARQGARNL